MRSGWAMPHPALRPVTHDTTAADTLAVVVVHGILSRHGKNFGKRC